MYLSRHISSFLIRHVVQLWSGLLHNLVCFLTNRKQRKKLHDRLRQSLRNKRNNNTNTGIGPNLANSARGHQIPNLPLQDLQLINVCSHLLVLNIRRQNMLNLYTYVNCQYVFCSSFYSNVMGQLCTMQLRGRPKQPCPQAKMLYLRMNTPHSPTSLAKGKEELKAYYVSLVNLVQF